MGYTAASALNFALAHQNAKVAKDRKALRVGTKEAAEASKITIESNVGSENCRTINFSIQFAVFAFGLSGLSATFSKLIRMLTEGLDDIISYLDDMLDFHQKSE